MLLFTSLVSLEARALKPDNGTLSHEIMKVKYRNYEAVFIHFDGKKTSFGCDFGNEALVKFKSVKTAKEMILFISTHNNKRLKLHSEYGLEFK